MAESSASDPVNSSQKLAPEQSPAGAQNRTDAVFISYASQDAAIADALCAALERAGIACWIAPRNVRPGDFYADAIVNAINVCPVLVLVLSKSSVDSAHVLREVERASAKKRPVIAFRIDATPLPPGLEYFLSASQWIDSAGERPDRLFPKLIDAIRSRKASEPGADLHSPPVDRQPPKQKLTRFAAAAAVVIVLGFIYFVADKVWLWKHANTEQAAAPGSPAQLRSLSLGTSNSGTVFGITPAGVETVLRSFGGTSADGAVPFGGLILGNDGVLYGTASAGGAASDGTVFRFGP